MADGSSVLRKIVGRHVPHGAPMQQGLCPLQIVLVRRVWRLRPLVAATHMHRDGPWRDGALWEDLGSPGLSVCQGPGIRAGQVGCRLGPPPVVALLRVHRGALQEGRQHRRDRALLGVVAVPDPPRARLPHHPAASGWLAGLSSPPRRPATLPCPLGCNLK